MQPGVLVTRKQSPSAIALFVWGKLAQTGDPSQRGFRFLRGVLHGLDRVTQFIQQIKQCVEPFGPERCGQLSVAGLGFLYNILE